MKRRFSCGVRVNHCALLFLINDQIDGVGCVQHKAVFSALYWAILCESEATLVQ